MKSILEKSFRCSSLCLLAAACLLISANLALAQDSSKKKGKSSKNDVAADNMLQLPEGQIVDRKVGEMLGAWQAGDIESLRQYYSNDVIVVSGAWEPPVMGWANYLKAYQAQRSRGNAGRLERRNTFIKVEGNSAWATYQWEYTALIDAKPTTYQGHTSLVLSKQAGQWVIVLNHTSLVPDFTSTAPSPAAGAQTSGQN